MPSGKDSALLRFGLGTQYLKAGDAARAAEHLRAAVAQDADYSAAWKLLGKALAQAGDLPGAAQAYRSGIAAAQRRGDKQAAPRDGGVPAAPGEGAEPAPARRDVEECLELGHRRALGHARHAPGARGGRA